jgi:hypothetical protein
MTGESSEGASSAAAAEVTKPTRRNRGSTPPDEDRGGCPSVWDGGARVREGSGGCVGSATTRGDGSWARCQVVLGLTTSEAHLVF